MSARTARRVMTLYAVSSLAAVAAGCAVAAAAGVPTGAWARDLGAWLLGGLLAWALAARPRWVAKPGVATEMVWAIALVVAATFLGAGLEGVQRWVSLGPLRLNAAMLLLPLAIVLLPAARGSEAAMVAVTALLAAQPDASQATAFAGAALILLAARQQDWRNGLSGVAIVALAVVAWLRADPLAPVAEVEGIIGLAWQQAPLLAVGAGLALGAAALSPLTATTHGRQPVVWALAVYMALVATMPALGAFPVPLVGITVSPILGFWLGIGGLAASLRLTGRNATVEG